MCWSGQRGSHVSLMRATNLQLDAKTLVEHEKNVTEPVTITTVYRRVLLSIVDFCFVGQVNNTVQGWWRSYNQFNARFVAAFDVLNSCGNQRGNASNTTTTKYSEMLHAFYRKSFPYTTAARKSASSSQVKAVTILTSLTLC